MCEISNVPVYENTSTIKQIFSDDLNIITFRYIPSQNEVLTRKSGLEFLKEIEEKISSKGLSIKPSQRFSSQNEDYPVITVNEDDPEIWLSYHQGRPVFRIRDKYYFRRYNDDWNDCVIFGSEKNGDICWETSITRKELLNISI